MKRENKLHIVFSLEDRNGEYSKHLGTLLVSIMENTTQKLYFHVLNDETLSNLKKEELVKICSKYEQEIAFHDMELGIDVKNSPIFKSGLASRAALYRLYVAELLKNESKILYLDCDVVVNGDIKKIFEIEMGKKSILAIKDKGIEKNPELYTRYIPVDPKKYFNSGVVLFDLDKIRKQYDMRKDCLEILMKYPKDPFPDQSALNYLFRDDCVIVSRLYNNFVDEHSEIDETVVWHFAGACKPWIVRSSKIDSLYWKYFRLTPWGEDIDFLFSCYSKTVEPLSIAVKTYPTGPKRQFFKNTINRMFREIIEIKKNYYS